MIDPRSMTEPITPPYAGNGALARIGAEIWTTCGLESERLPAPAHPGCRPGTRARGHPIWVLAAMGNNLAPGVIIGWWFGWSVFEVVVRLGAKPYVKGGPWWGQRYRKASLMDMTCYVGFKNLLIGATLFLTLKSMGLLVI